jgi:hypothetical protein
MLTELNQKSKDRDRQKMWRTAHLASHVGKVLPYLKEA